jgi:hypothetical protein
MQDWAARRLRPTPTRETANILHACAGVGERLSANKDSHISGADTQNPTGGVYLPRAPGGVYLPRAVFSRMDPSRGDRHPKKKGDWRFEFWVWSIKSRVETTNPLLTSQHPKLRTTNSISPPTRLGPTDLPNVRWSRGACLFQHGQRQPLPMPCRLLLCPLTRKAPRYLL